MDLSEKALLTIEFVLQNHSSGMGREKALLFHSNLKKYCLNIAVKEVEIKKNSLFGDKPHFLCEVFPDQYTIDGQQQFIELELLARGNVLTAKEVDFLQEQAKILERDNRVSYREYAELFSQAKKRDFISIKDIPFSKAFRKSITNTETINPNNNEIIEQKYSEHFDSPSEVFPRDSTYLLLSRLANSYIDAFSEIDISEPNYGFESIGLRIGYYVDPQIKEALHKAANLFQRALGPSSKHAQVLLEKLKEVDICIGVAHKNFEPFNEISAIYLHGIELISKQVLGPISVEGENVLVINGTDSDFLSNCKHTLKDEKMKRIVDITSHIFDVSLSFPGEVRAIVESIASELEVNIGPHSYFYDNNYKAQLSRPSLDTMLQNIYSNSRLIVVFLCEKYQEKEWCGIEFRVIKEIIKNKEYNRVMFVRMDDGKVDGVFSIDGYIDGRTHTPKEIADFIVERLVLLT